jgi:hypothetical protein
MEALSGFPTLIWASATALRQSDGPVCDQPETLSAV